MCRRQAGGASPPWRLRSPPADPLGRASVPRPRRLASRRGGSVAASPANRGDHRGRRPPQPCSPLGFYCPGGFVASSPGSGTSVLSLAPPCCTTSPTSPTSFTSGASHSLFLSSPI